MYYILEHWTAENAAVENIVGSTSLKQVLKIAALLGVAIEKLEQFEEELISDSNGNVTEVYTIETVNTVQQFMKEYNE